MQTITKKQAWEELREHFSHVVDGYGTPIDDGIMEVVLALNACGVNTLASCQGHLNWGNAYPWIRVGVIGIDALEETFYQARRKGQDTERLQQELRCKHLPEEMKLVEQLDAFYQQHQFGYDRHLVISHILSGECSLASQGADLQDIRETEERAQKLTEYQEEMQSFGAFLKTVFFGEVALIDRWYTTAETAAILGLEDQTITRHIERGNLHAEKRGRDYLVASNELEAFQRRRRGRGRPVVK